MDAIECTRLRKDVDHLSGEMDKIWKEVEEQRESRTEVAQLTERLDRVLVHLEGNEKNSGLLQRFNRLDRNAITYNAAFMLTTVMAAVTGAAAAVASSSIFHGWFSSKKP